MSETGSAGKNAGTGGGGFFSWVLPAIAMLVLVKALGLLPAAAAFLVYYGLKQRFGVALSLLAGVAAAGATAVVALSVLMP